MFGTSPPYLRDQHFPLDLIPTIINWTSGQEQPQESKLFHLSYLPIFLIPMRLPLPFPMILSNSPMGQPFLLTPHTHKDQCMQIASFSQVNTKMFQKKTTVYKTMAQGLGLY